MESHHQKELRAEKKHFWHSLLLPVVFVIFCLLSWLLALAFGSDFPKLGIVPRSLANFYGIISHVFIHANWSHLFGNMISFFVLSTCLFYFYRGISYKIFFYIWLSEGVLLWFLGRDGHHVGASGLIYGLAFFLFWSGVFKKHTPLIAISLLVAFLYGNFVWGIFPMKIDDPTSWEGHLSGALSGVLLAILFRNQGPMREIHHWNEEETEEESDSQEEETPDDSKNIVSLVAPKINNQSFIINH
jgi:membrane associated rhomboid family serine protease